MVRRFTENDAIKWVNEFYNWCVKEGTIGEIQGRSFVWYDQFKKYVFLTRGSDKHTIYKYRDFMRLFNLLAFDVFDRVYFKFKENNNKQNELKRWFNG